MHDREEAAARRALGARVRALRARVGLSPRQLAERVDVDVDELRAFEAGESAPLADALLARLRGGRSVACADPDAAPPWTAAPLRVASECRNRVGVVMVRS